MKQIKIIYQNGNTHDELLLHRSIIYQNLIDCIKALVAVIEQLSIEVQSDKVRALHEYVKNYSTVHDSQTMLDPKVGQAIRDIWQDPSATRAMDRQSGFYLMDSAP